MPAAQAATLRMLLKLALKLQAGRPFLPASNSARTASANLSLLPAGVATSATPIFHLVEVGCPSSSLRS